MKKLKMGDITVIAVIIMLTVGLYIYGGTLSKNGQTAMIVCDGKESFYSLSEEREIPINSNGVSLTVVIEDGYAYVKETDCPSKSCMNMGKIRKNGQTVVCVPARVYVKIVGEGAEDYDVSLG